MRDVSFLDVYLWLFSRDITETTRESIHIQNQF